MKTNNRSQRILNGLKRGLIWITLFVFTLAIIGVIYQTAATDADQRKYPPPGILVNVDGYKMHIYCMGEGSPTILLDHVGGGSSVDWALIQPELAEHTRVCAYDRAGFGWSDYNPAPRTMEQQVHELHGLLEGANEKGPYIYVGHSYGARVALVFAEKYPQEVAGMVLMDAGKLIDDARYPAEAISEYESENRMIHTLRWLAPFGLVRLLQPLINNPTYDLPDEAHMANAAFSASARYWLSLNNQTESLPQVYQEERQIKTLGGIPILVLISTEPDDASHKVWSEMNIEMAALSTHGSYHIVSDATHMSLAYRQKDAQVCVDGILSILNAVHSMAAR
jgi:pimeloyl-ACP methyl ester carboxylesterase